MLKTSENERVADLYLDLMKKCLTRMLFEEYYEPAKIFPGDIGRILNSSIQRHLAPKGIETLKRKKLDRNLRENGRDWPWDAETMVGLKRLENLQYCVRQALRDNIPGDLLEAGVWRGGASIFMKATLTAYGNTDKKVWLADSFEGLPKPDEGNYPNDKNDKHWTFDRLKVSLEEVQKNFERYGLLDENVRFLKGWFCDTLPVAPVDKLCILRADGDMYSSTMDILNSMYSKLCAGGFIIIDDYALDGCKAAVHDFRKEHDIKDEITDIDGTGVFWRKSS